MRDLSAIFKAYDVRGTVPDQLDADVARRVGAAFAEFTGASAVLTGHDMRRSSPPLAAAFAAGVTGRGVEVIDIGLASTDLVYFGSGRLDLPGAMFTASHNPARYNGIKLCLAGARPVGQDTGLADIRALAERDVATAEESLAASGGRLSRQDLLADYAEYLNKLAPVPAGRRLKVVVDAGNGMAGHTVPTVFAGLPVDLTRLYFDLDGSFPNHEANPIDPANLRDLQVAVGEVGADVGFAFDGDADRCFVVDEQGQVVSPSALTALIADRELAREPGATVVHNLITSRAVPELVRHRGGIPVRTRVGHSFIKAEMARTGAVFGGEHSGHFYFRDFWYADSGMLAALHVLAALAEVDRPLSTLLAGYSGYVASGEVNSTVVDPAGRLAAVEVAYAGRPGSEIDHTDGLTVAGPADEGWWFNLRPSNTEPLLRLNVEALDTSVMIRVRDDVLRIARAEVGS